MENEKVTLAALNAVSVNNTYLYCTHHPVDPLLISLHAVTFVHHNRLPCIVDAAPLSTNFTFGSQQPELKHIDNATSVCK